MGSGNEERKRGWIEPLLDVVFPPVCVHCGGLVDSGDWRSLCSHCVRRITFALPPHCRTCGHPFFGEVGESRCCPHCIELNPVYGEGRVICLLRGPMRSWIHALKYHRAEYVLRDIPMLLLQNKYLMTFLADSVLVPVPLHRRRRAERGFNQSQRLAECFAAAVAGTRVANLLTRVIDTPTQTRLDRAARRTNLKNAFAKVPKAVLDPRSRYILVDDVFTTGSTLNACASVLRKAGARTIDVVTLGHG